MNMSGTTSILQQVTIRFSIVWMALAELARAIFKSRGNAGRTTLQRTIVGILRQNGLRLVDMPPAMARARIEIMSTGCSVKRLIVREKVDVDGLPGEWFRPKSTSSDAAMLYLHGGGYVLGSTEGYRDLLGRLAVFCGLPVLAVDYRLAPEHPYPAAVDDCARAFRWLREQGVRSDRTIIAGDSSGAALAVATMLVMREHREALPRAACLLSPWVDLCASTGSIVSNATNDWGDEQYLRHWAELYLGDVAASDVLASPTYADLQGLPPIMIQVGGDEVLLDQVVAFASTAQRAGCEVALEIFPGMVHAWHMLAIAYPQADQALVKLAAFVKTQLATTQPVNQRLP